MAYEPIEINVNPKRDESFRSCDDCIHCEDDESLCILRKCVHAIGCLHECYRPKKELRKNEPIRTLY